MSKRTFQKNVLPVFLGVLLIVILSGTYLQSKEPQVKDMTLEEIRQDVRQNLYDEVYAQLKSEMQGVIREEVKKEVETYLAQNPGVVGNMAMADSQQSDIQRMVRVAVKDIFSDPSLGYGAQSLSDPQLDVYVAGDGIQTTATVGDGAASKPVQASEKWSESQTSVAKMDSEAAGAGEVRNQESLERTLQQRGSILLPKGTLQFEPGVTWAHFSSSQVTVNGVTILDAITIGDLFTQKSKRDTLIQSFSFKYGLMNNFQGELKVPLRFQYDRVARVMPSSVVSETTSSRYGLGDVEFGVSRQVGWEHGLMPDLVANMTIKTPTGEDPYGSTAPLGTGHWSVRTALIAAKSSDPMVVFGSLSYTANLQRNNITGYGDINPGDTIGYSLGTAIALSYKTAINFSFDHSLTNKSEINNSTIEGSFVNAASFKTGLSWAINERKSLEVSVGMGITEDAPDASFEVRVPMTF